MASLTIRNLDDNLIQHLRIESTKNGHSMEDEAQIIIARELGYIFNPSKNIEIAINEPMDRDDASS